MFIEVTSKDKPLYLRVGDIVMVGVDDKRGTFIVTESMDGITVKESYEEIKSRIDAAEKKLFPHRYKTSELKNCQNV